MTIDVRVVSNGDFARAAAALREEDARFPTELRKTIVRTIRPYVQRAKANARAIPVHGIKHTGLRRRVAAGVRIKPRTLRSPGVTIETSMADVSEAIIPRGMDSRAGWRHPVYGNTDNWVRQTTGGSWFRAPLADSKDEMQRAIRDDINEMFNRIDRAT
jgi:hypothetical protein